MKTANPPLLIGAAYVSSDLGVSRSKAYGIIKELNHQLKERHPTAIIVPGRVNRLWYLENCRFEKASR